jgi:hypothetical protein
VTLEEIVSELRKLEIEFALVTRARKAPLGAEAVAASLDRDGMPQHPGQEAWLLCRGLTRILDLCEQNRLAVALSFTVANLQERLAQWE